MEHKKSRNNWLNTCVIYNHRVGMKDLPWLAYIVTSLVCTQCMLEQTKSRLRNNIYEKLFTKFIVYFSSVFWKPINQGWCKYFVNWEYNGKRW